LALPKGAPDSTAGIGRLIQTGDFVPRTVISG
jgi:hypothetical protein